MLVASLISALALCSGLTGAAPAKKRDSAIGTEVAVSAPNGTPESDLGATATASVAADPASITYYSTVPTNDGSDVYTTYSYSTISEVQSDGSYSTFVSTYTYTTTSDFAAPTEVSSGSSYEYPSYGSGSVTWQSSYSDCVQVCMAQYAPPPSVWDPSTYGISTGSSSYGSSGSSSDGGAVSSGDVSSGAVSSGDVPSATIPDGSGGVGGAVTHTIIVAPTQGVLRYVPFAINASVGDVIMWTWGAGPHTVTQSSETSICNKTDGGFASGKQNASFVFTQTLNDTNPLFIYCGVPGHCEKGMFSIINPPNAFGGATSVGSMMPMWANADPNILAAVQYTQNKTAGTPAENWGSDIDVGGIDPTQHPAVATNVLFTRLVIGANPSTLDANGNFKPTGPINIPNDLPAVLASTASTYGYGSTGSSSSPSAGSANAGSSTPGSESSQASGAASVTSSSLAVGVVALAAIWFAL